MLQLLWIYYSFLIIDLYELLVFDVPPRGVNVNVKHQALLDLRLNENKLIFLYVKFVWTISFL